MKIKTADLIDAALDWVVIYAQCLEATEGKPILARDLADIALRNGAASATTDWSKGGPIIERECIATYASGACSVAPKNPDYWVAEILATEEMITQYGPTPLIAAMRCFVASKLGDEVDVPDELV